MEPVEQTPLTWYIIKSDFEVNEWTGELKENKYDLAGNIKRFWEDLQTFLQTSKPGESEQSSVYQYHYKNEPTHRLERKRFSGLKGTHFISQSNPFVIDS